MNNLTIDVIIESIEKDNQIHRMLLSYIVELEERIKKLEEEKCFITHQPT